MGVRWFMTLLLFSGMLHSGATEFHKSRITVGSGLNCHYPPERLNQAIQAHNTLYLTTGTVYPPIEINSPRARIIGGLSDCADWKPLRNNSQKSIISGFNVHRPVTIKQQELHSAMNTSIQLIQLRLINGHSDFGGGLKITGPAKVYLQDSVVENNIATNHGGGMAVSGSPVELQIIDSLIQNNRAEELGGGLSCHGNHRIIMNNKHTIQANQAPLADNYLLNQNCFIKINLDH